MVKKVMVIDDEPDISIYLRTVLEDHGFETCTADGNETVGLAVREHKPDLIILDIMMPKRSGISIYKELRTSPDLKDIPVALISGMAPAGDFKETGFRSLIQDDAIPSPDEFFEKPIEIKGLIKFVNQFLG